MPAGKHTGILTELQTIVNKKIKKSPRRHEEYSHEKAQKAQKEQKNDQK
ncbi:MAG: hypothetical protein WBC22_16505 [Sedimentisphaerales bacterium]